jgi:hypothetical protein
MDLSFYHKFVAVLAVADDADFLAVYLLNNLMSIDSHADSLIVMICSHSDHSRATTMLTTTHVATFSYLPRYLLLYYTMFPKRHEEE